ncbi:MetQ/NlpA family ABC transporter substrate-binding protein [Exiguobacterium sp. SH3S2]|uniref:MetQ/NlpA family ABC transporter substrate-binding protein n=1 Tax=unclassified Exiguobacterium TaxID=2644629 RepID=UPI00103E2A72|nr:MULTISPECIES: MetQ/NlpA family ABC transporter substrate-binding protein [unclassified Exiguobacterium]TCI24395.1 MetQ/NlpA family ABC transporter substrate-binding protein [Exiguobacterium sp. SH5S4]TCI45778.1 MetQ/NlpA family ABC transporter substrate-binding protein [Exiguobacterium sp. SH3S3]TCI50811.1 MetQ/NlpA family ABC transporter substrate-binding protein [Exiguobacterium sp. SH5S13]TCI59315.1 MetQ/NlpA family ABC transporter substrate-binding protein [Exiguobacterium sp. SH3S1]TCI
MNIKQKTVLAGTSLLAAIALSACGQSDASEALSTESLTIGVTGGPHQQIAEKVKELAAEDGLELDIKVFNDYNTPNTALDEGSLDVNSYQTLSFLELQKSDKGYKIDDVFKTVAFPMGLYSDKLTDIKELKEGDKVAVPNDPANELRALRLYETAGLITLKEGLTDKATKRDIAENPLNLEFIELEASQLPTQLPEVALAAINTNFAMGAGLSINEDALFHEDTVDNPYPNYVVVRTDNKDDEVVETLKSYYHSDEVRTFIEETFNGSIVPAF